MHQLDNAATKRDMAVSVNDVNRFAVACFYEIEAFISIALLSFDPAAKASAFAHDGFFFGADG